MLLSKIFLALSDTSGIEQAQSESLIALCTLAYQIDGKIKAEEQELMKEFLNRLPWHDGIRKETFHKNIINKSRDAIEKKEVEKYIQEFGAKLKDNSELLSMISDLLSSDGEVSEPEMALLQLLKDNLI